MCIKCIWYRIYNRKTLATGLATLAPVLCGWVGKTRLYNVKDCIDTVCVRDSALDLLWRVLQTSSGTKGLRITIVIMGLYGLGVGTTDTFASTKNVVARSHTFASLMVIMAGLVSAISLHLNMTVLVPVIMVP